MQPYIAVTLLEKILKEETTFEQLCYEGHIRPEHRIESLEELKHLVKQILSQKQSDDYY